MGAKLLSYISLGNKCQYWLKESSRELTSPYFKYGTEQTFYHNMNCTWILKAEQGFYINIEIDYFYVNNNGPGLFKTKNPKISSLSSSNESSNIAILYFLICGKSFVNSSSYFLHKGLISY